MGGRLKSLGLMLLIARLARRGWLLDSELYTNQVSVGPVLPPAAARAYYPAEAACWSLALLPVDLRSAGFFFLAGRLNSDRWRSSDPDLPAFKWPQVSWSAQWKLPGSVLFTRQPIQQVYPINSGVVRGKYRRSKIAVGDLSFNVLDCKPSVESEQSFGYRRRVRSLAIGGKHEKRLWWRWWW